MAGLVGLLSEPITSGRILGAAGILLILLFVIDVTTRPSYPASIPRVGYGTGFVASVKNYFMAYVRHKAWVAEGYEKVRLGSEYITKRDSAWSSSCYDVTEEV